jgi:hypothetical protein
MSQDLDFRISRFARFPKPDIKVSDLIFQYRLFLDDDFRELQHACVMYMCKSAEIPFTPFVDEVLDYYVNNRDKLKHVTPNGLMVPKRHASLEFNLVARAFYAMLDRHGFYDLIQSWNVPLNMRIKFGPASKDHLERKFASEHIHSDAWVGENKECGTAMLLIMGDAPHNTVNFYHPSDNFSSEWLVSHDSYKDASDKFMDNYTHVPCVTHVGDLMMSDFATLHNSRADLGCGPRVSIDTTFSYVAEADNWRGDRANLDIIRQVGTRYFFFFPHRVDDKVDSQGGKKQAVNSKIVDMMP